jgi:hypothetical protein
MNLMGSHSITLQQQVEPNEQFIQNSDFKTFVHIMHLNDVAMYKTCSSKYTLSVCQIFCLLFIHTFLNIDELLDTIL